VIAAAQFAAQIAAQDEASSVISGSTILGIVLGCVVLWAVVGTVYTFLKRKKISKLQNEQNPTNQQQNPMAKLQVSEAKQTSPPLSVKLEEIKPAILTVSANNKIVSGVLHTPISLPSPQLKPRPHGFERRDLQVFQATTVRNMRPGSRIRQIRREEK
jgi:hypothetical protein